MPIPIKDGLLQVFDVDHGQCSLLTLPAAARHHRVLIDCGHATDLAGAPWYPGKFLQDCGINHVDLLIVTNYDEDHVSGFADLIARGITIGCILGNPTVAPQTIVTLKSETGIGAGINALVSTMLARRQQGYIEQVPSLPGLLLKWAYNPYPFFDDENNLSLVANLNIHGWNFMFAGDMELLGWRHLLATCPPFRQTVRAVHVLNAAHHGRENGKCPEMFDVYGCAPRLVFISDDYKQYDTQETTNFYASKTTGVGWFREGGARKVLTTRKDGELLFTFQNGGILVH